MDIACFVAVGGRGEAGRLFEKIAEVVFVLKAAYTTDTFYALLGA